MTDGSHTQQPAAEPAPQAQPAQPEPQQQDVVTVPRDEYQSLTRAAQQYKGAAPMIQQFVERGIKSADDVADLLDLYGTARERNVDIRSLRSAFQPPAAPTPQAQQTPDVAGLVSAEVSRYQHRAAEEAQMAYEASLAGELAGDTQDTAVREAIHVLVTAKAEQLRRPYPQGHPLHGQYQPLTQADYARVKQEASSLWNTVRGGPRPATPGVATVGGVPPAVPGPQAPTPTSQARAQALQLMQRAYAQGQPASAM